jgi:hypothetical protein
MRELSGRLPVSSSRPICYPSRTSDDDVTTELERLRAENAQLKLLGARGRVAELGRHVGDDLLEPHRRVGPAHEPVEHTACCRRARRLGHGLEAASEYFEARSKLECDQPWPPKLTVSLPSRLITSSSIWPGFPSEVHAGVGVDEGLVVGVREHALSPAASSITTNAFCDESSTPFGHRGYRERFPLWKQASPTGFVLHYSHRSGYLEL